MQDQEEEWKSLIQSSFTNFHDIQIYTCVSFYTQNSHNTYFKLSRQKSFSNISKSQTKPTVSICGPKNLQNARLQISYFSLSYFYCLLGLLNFYFLPFSQNIQIQNFENISIWCCGNLYFCYYNIILSLLYYYLCYKLAVKYICKYEKDVL